MNTANWLTLLASVITLLSVILSYFTSRAQLRDTNKLALKQIEASAAETSRKLKADILLTEKQAWVKEFRNTINDLLHIGDPYLDSSVDRTAQERVELLTLLAHRIDLLLPSGEAHAALTQQITPFIAILHENGTNVLARERLDLAGKITILTKRILKEELAAVEANI
jgi:hypothetical protein